MKAIVIEVNGGPEVLSHRTVPDPAPGPRDLLVSVTAAGLNYIDTYHRVGLYPMELPVILGREGAGVVDAVGAEVTDFSTGDHVGWVDVMGSYAEKVVIPAGSAIRVPNDIALEVAAAVLLQGITAHYLAVDTFPLAQGDRCVIHAAAGGVGRLLTQIAKSRGAEVFATVGSREKRELAESAGADHVIVYTETDFQEAVASIAGEHVIDVVYDGVGAATFEKGLDLLRPRGMMVTFGNASGPVPEISPLILATKGSIFLTRPTIGHYMRTDEETAGRISDLFAWIRSGRLDVHIGASFPLADTADAHRALENRSTTGKVLLLP